MRLLQRSGLVIFLLLVGFGANAQDLAGLSERVSHYTTEINGELEPGRIPFGTKLDFFFREYYPLHVGEVGAMLSASDAAKLARFVREEDNRRQQRTARLSRENDQLCSEADNLSAEAAATRIDRMDANYSAERSATYQELMQSLSANGRGALEDLIAKEITPNLQYAELDTVGLWSEFPDIFLGQLRVICTMTPAELQRMAEQAAQEPSNQSASQSTFGTLAN